MEKGKRIESQKVIVALRKTPREEDKTFSTRVEEMKGLCEAAGAVVIDIISQERPKPDSALYLGRGKVEQIAAMVGEMSADCVIFDDELSPAQIRNLEKELACRVADRTQLILDIFAIRANSKAGRIQVEIAQLQYMLPRLAGRGTQMSKLGAGIGTRGPGETKLETDRRRIHKRIAHLQNQMKHVERVRTTQRANRVQNVPLVALVGYTNAGKTSVLNAWTKDRGTDNAPEGNRRLFDTLDPAARRVRAGKTGSLVVLDTVGFIRNLPHSLVNAFHSTLEEVLAADLIVQVVDASDDVQTHLETTYKVLKEIGAETKPCITFFNKMDLAPIEPAPDTIAVMSVFGSAWNGEGMDELYDSVDKMAGFDPVVVQVSIPKGAEDLWGKVMQAGKLIQSSSEEGGLVRVTMHVDRNQMANWNETFGAVEWDEQ